MSSPDAPILMTADAVGGVWTYAIDLASALCARSYRVLLCVLGPAPTLAQRSQAQRIPNLELFECNEPLEWMDDPWEGVAKSGRFLVELAHARKPKLVHLNGYAHAALDFGAPKLVVAHSCVLSWWQAVKREALPARYTPYREAVTRGLRSADLVVAPTRAMLRTLQQHYGELPRTRVIYNGRDPNRSRDRHKQQEVFCAARLWDEAKNVATLARAAAGLPWPVYVAGEAQASLDNVIALGRLEPSAVLERFQRAAIYALPARYEPFGLSLLEAALAGSALVVGDIASLREIWQDSALYVPPDNAKALHEGLAALIENPARRLEFARRAERRARDFPLHAMRCGYEAAYRSLSPGSREARAAGACSETGSKVQPFHERIGF